MKLALAYAHSAVGCVPDNNESQFEPRAPILMEGRRACRKRMPAGIGYYAQYRSVTPLLFDVKQEF